jgi:hypothetical protein
LLRVNSATTRLPRAPQWLAYLRAQYEYIAIVARVRPLARHSAKTRRQSIVVSSTPYPTHAMRDRSTRRYLE